MKNTTDAIGLVIQGPSGNDRLYGGVVADIVIGVDGQDLLVGHNWSLQSLGFSDGYQDVLSGGNGYDGYIVSKDSAYFDSALTDLPGLAFAAADNFSYALFNASDRVIDSGGSGYVQLDSPVAASVTLAGWTEFNGIDGVTYDLKTSGSAYQRVDV